MKREKTSTTNRRKTKTRASSVKRKNTKVKETMMRIPPTTACHPPPPPGYSPYPPPPHPAYYYPYPYPPPPPYQHHQYAPMPPLQAPPPTNSTPTSTISTNTVPTVSPPAPKKTKRASTTTKKSKKSQPTPKIVSSSVETADDVVSNNNTPEENESSVGSKGTIVPHENDVLMGRGGKNNTHVGNEKLRGMARAMREVYIVSRKKIKTNMARQLVQQVFELDPPGRFLQRDPVTMVWEEVDLDTARHKTSQCLRDAASEKSSYTRIGGGSLNKTVTEDEEDDTTSTPLPMESVESGTQTTINPTETDRPTTPIEQISSSPSIKEDDMKRAMTPVLSNMAHKIEPSPLQPQQLIEDSPTRSRIESWESANFARNLIEAWEDNNGSFHQLASRTHPPPPLSRWGSMDNSCGSSSHHRRMYTWMSANSADMEIEDAVLIPPEELDAVEDGDEFFSLLDDSQLDDVDSSNHNHIKDEEMQVWQPEMYEESGSPFDTDFFY